MASQREEAERWMETKMKRRRRGQKKKVHTLLSIELLVTNGLSPALCELKPDNRCDLNILIIITHAKTL